MEVGCCNWVLFRLVVGVLEMECALLLMRILSRECVSAFWVLEIAYDMRFRVYLEI